MVIPEVERGQLRHSAIHWSVCLQVASSSTSESAEGWRGHSTVQLTSVENSYVQMSAFCDQEPSWQHISFHSMLNNCRLSSGFVLCLSLEVGVWSWTETKGHFCILIYWDCFTALAGLYFITVCFGLVRCWPLGMFYWTLFGKLKPNSLLLVDSSATGSTTNTKQELKRHAF